MNPREISIDSFSYDLPTEKIAFFPLADRDASKLLVRRNNELEDAAFVDVAHYLPPDASVVFNDTRVVEARILFEKSTGARIEIFCLEPADPHLDVALAMQQKGQVLWNCMIGGASKWKPGQVLQKHLTSGILEARYVKKMPDCFVIELCWLDSTLSFAEILHEAGDMPLPPYIKRHVDDADKSRYQTLYAQQEGSVAAPTAGLHFTTRVIDSLKAKNIEPLYLTLHVGAGTFKPVKAERMNDHHMHAEFIDVSMELLKQLATNASQPVIAVGTTSLRTLESLYWIAVDIKTNDASPGIDYELDQWFPYNNAGSISKEEALNILMDHLSSIKSERLIAKTRLLVMPGYTFNMVDILITNFHQPRSTLLLLVAAFAGPNWKKIYEHALENGYRFLSYGDSCLLYRH